MSADELYREFEHTGDLGIELTAPDWHELLRRAALAIAALMVDTSNVRPLTERVLTLSPAADDAGTLHDLLSALLNLFLVDGFIWSQAQVTAEQPKRLTLRLWGESFDSGRHEFRREIKAVTYHALVVERLERTWRARVIFDI